MTARVEDAGSQCEFDLMFAKMQAPSSDRYILVCHHCGSGNSYKTNCKTVKQARQGNLECECGGYWVLAADREG